ncbi:MBL fold metallo-hydrolase [Eubacteriales bacterium OttesenSCG-928-M02]|nr:MBL fold metallo-hydrolase [Eubacteriales bacterium OttesenSCG-928-M02]
MRLTVIGKYGPYPRKGCSTTSYLLEVEEQRFLLDCGAGTASYLEADVTRLTAIFLSHLHADHVSDLLLLNQMLGVINPAIRIPVYVQRIPGPVYQYLSTMDVLFLQPIDIGEAYAFGDVKVEFCPMVHPLPSVAMAVEGEGKRFVYTGDTQYHKGLLHFAMDADGILMDTAFPQNMLPENPPHMSAREGAKLAKACGAKLALFSHIHPQADEDAMRQEAEAIFPTAQIVEEGAHYFI